MRRALVVLALTLAATAAHAQSPKVIDVRAARPQAANSFEALWSVYRKAVERADAEAALAALREIRRLRLERNIHSLEPFALAMVGDGLRLLAKGDITRAEDAFQTALQLDPYLPDAHFALGVSRLKLGPFGVLASIKGSITGVTARLTTARGHHHLVALLIPVGLVSLYITSVIFALALLARHGALLLHDLEETLGPVYGRPGAMSLFAGLLLLPLLVFQGWGFAPIWWLALLAPYMTRLELGALVVPAMFLLVTGPAVDSLGGRLQALENPLFRAGLVAIEGWSDPRAVAALEGAVKETADDRDLVLLLATLYKKAGRYEDASGVYQGLLGKAPSDAVALNNLGNLAFAAGEFQAAIARYKQAIDAGPTADVMATLYYNMQLAHLQKFEYQPAQEARSQADRLGSGVVRTYESLWKYDKGDYAVADLGLTSQELWAKFLGKRLGIRQKNVMGKPSPGGGFRVGALFNPLIGFALVAVFGHGISRLWRGSRTFTTSCVKCGTAFCKRCHIGGAAQGLCTQCHHLFVVRDGVSGPARNQKLLEVQKEDARRERLFRALSLVLPGAGHVYARRTIMGLALVFAWALLLTLAWLTGRVLPLTDASSAVSRPWGLGALGVLLLVVYVVANRARPDFEVPLLVGRSAPSRRGRFA